MRTGSDGDAVAELVEAILVEAVAAVLFEQAVATVDVHIRDAGFAGGKGPVVVVDDVEARDANLGKVEVSVGTRIERIVSRPDVADAEFIDDRRREDMQPLASVVLILRLHAIAELGIVDDLEQIGNIRRIAEEDLDRQSTRLNSSHVASPYAAF